MMGATNGYISLDGRRSHLVPRPSQPGLTRFYVEREAGGFTREIELDAADATDAQKRVAALHSHQRGRAIYRVNPI